jgi:hypothetical protein
MFENVNYIKKTIVFQKILTESLKLDKIPLFNPENELKMLLDLLIVSYNTFYLLSISISVCFNTTFGVYGHLFH